MISIRPIAIHTEEEAREELKKIGLPHAQARMLATGTLCLHLKLEEASATAVPCLRTKADELGGHPIVRTASSESSSKHDALLVGTASEIEELAASLETESGELSEVSSTLREVLKNMAKTRFSVTCRTTTLELGRRTLIMGVVNVTPDSFSDGGAFLHRDRAIARALEMIEEGADVIDIGGESTKPGSRPVDVEEELARIVPVIRELANRTEIPISVDTRKARVAREALEAGGQIINDVSALRFDPEMAGVVSSYEVPVILMHMRGTPETMQQDIHYGSLISEIIQYLKESMKLALEAGVEPDRIMIDPGIGFGKTVDHNLAIIRHLYQFRILGKPILIGTSRKSFIGKILDLEVDEREEGTMASVAASILNGAHIVRVHNVRNAVRVARIADAIKWVSLPEA